jgi:hypothetical protein
MKRNQAKKRVAIKRQIRSMGLNVPFSISEDIGALRLFRQSASRLIELASKFKKRKPWWKL